MKTVGVLFAIVFFSVTNGAKILLMPGPGTSHCLEMISIGEELLKRGHQVTLYSLLIEPQRCLSKIDTSSKSFKVVTPNLKPEFLKEHETFFARISNAFYERKGMFYVTMNLLYPLVKSNCDAAFLDMELLRELRKENYDIVLIEGVPFMLCFMAIPVYLKAPMVSVGSFIDTQDSRTPLQSNIFPSYLTEYSNDMSYFQRVINTVLFVVTPIFRSLLLTSVDMSVYDKELAGIDVTDLIKDSLLFIENSDYLVDYPKAVFPNFVQVGGLTANPAKPLPKDFQKTLDDAKDGAILVTFGSMLSALPMDLREKLVSAFSRLKQTVLFKQESNDERGNVKIYKWLPQNDILGHPNTKLFISHCGKNGFWEGVYHGVPIICMAIHAETFSTKVKVKRYGIGSSINIFDDTVDELVETINGVLTNQDIHKNMKKIATMLKDRPETPRQRAASAIEHVIKYGGEHMRPPSVNFGYFAYFNLDVLAFLVGIDFVLIVLIVCCVRRCCCRKKETKRKTE